MLFSDAQHGAGVKRAQSGRMFWNQAFRISGFQVVPVQMHDVSSERAPRMAYYVRLAFLMSCNLAILPVQSAIIKTLFSIKFDDDIYVDLRLLLLGYIYEAKQFTVYAKRW